MKEISTIKPIKSEDHKLPIKVNFDPHRVKLSSEISVERMTRTDENESKENLKEPILSPKCEEIDDKEDWTTSQSSIVKVMVLIVIKCVTPYKSPLETKLRPH